MSPNGIYATRSSRAWNTLSDEHFDAANTGGNYSAQLFFIGGGCLDAPEQIPAGSMQSIGGRPDTAFTAQRIISRGEMELGTEEMKRRAILAEKLISELLAELKDEHDPRNS
ncbi:hypothetical protein [Hydrogenophaga sp. NFH-34]|uniref:hypothetical protein n=1 Tax=Hydrogenophaga sp. NFH-34 TaxID=2744446 RepID=UPI001F2B517D|nr:hypothetical protein [Hydrogenophaga sp. NFH-34]